MSYPVQKSDSEWQAVLSPGKSPPPPAGLLTCFTASANITSAIEQFRVLRKQGTEAPFSHKFDKHMPDKAGPGVYTCAACDTPLYTASHKFKSGCGWPAFFDAIPGAVTRHEDRTFGMARTEIVCSNCGGHLGHVFKGEGYPTPTDERHCVNGISLNFANDGKTPSKE